MAARKTSYRSEFATLENKCARLDADIAVTRERLVELETRSRQMKSRILKLRTAFGDQLGLPSTKNVGVYTAWAAFKRVATATRPRDGIAPQDLFAALQDDLPGLKSETLRSYLRRMKQAGLIRKRGAYWHRTHAELEGADRA